MAWQIITPKRKQEWDGYYDLRYTILRQPWHQPKGSEKSDNEDACTHALLVDEDSSYIACGRSEWVDSRTIQIRYMAVSNAFQGQGAGGKILRYLEEKAKSSGATKVILHARENAIIFYTKHGYATKEKSHLLFGEIQHFLMQKDL
jgi:N-acetylglutamate synthase-like GNAT family acetyltransferase